MIEKLGNNKGQDVDEEQVYKMAAVLEPCNGLDATLIRLVILQLTETRFESVCM